MLAALDPVEAALVAALNAATAAVARGDAKALDVVLALTTELRDRRRERAGVVALDAAQRGPRDNGAP